MSSHNTTGLISEVSEKVASQIGKNCRRLFCTRVRFGPVQGRSGSSNADDFGTNRKRVYDFLLVGHCDYGPILIILISSVISLPFGQLGPPLQPSFISFTHSPSFFQWRGERYDGTSTRTGPLQSKKK